MLGLGFDLLPSTLSIIHLSELTIFIISNARFYKMLECSKSGRRLQIWKFALGLCVDGGVGRDF